MIWKDDLMFIYFREPLITNIMWRNLLIQVFIFLLWCSKFVGSLFKMIVD